MKKFLFSLVVALVLLGAMGLYSAVKHRDFMRQARRQAKAPEASVTLIDGWTNRQIADYLQKQGLASSADFLSAVKDFNIAEYGSFLPKEADGNLEGFLFPDTYFIPAAAPSGTSLSDIVIKKALANFQSKFTPAMAQQAAADNMSVYQIVTLASIVEKEAGNNTDKAMIAGVFYNRLKAGMPLQSDATAAFAAEENLPSYNTYGNTGLPAGPICNPGLGSLMAALYPTASNYFYFLTDPKTGQAIYAQTYQEHLANKSRYLSK